MYTRRPRALVAALILLGPLTLSAGCGGSEAGPDVDVTNDIDVKCDVDSSASSATAYPGTLGTALNDSFCPRADKDYWKFTTGGPRQLLAVTLDYNKLSGVQLAAETLGPVGKCTPSPITTCSNPTPCGAGQLCDAARGGCRATDAAPCTTNPDCGGGQACASAEETLGTVRETAVNSNVHHLTGHFPAFVAGDYVVSVYDHSELEADASTQYTLNVTSVQDPDTAEPNNAKARATTVSSGSTSTGYLSYVNDEDWYRVVPGTATPAVVKIDLTWSATAVIKPTWTLSQGTWQFASTAEKTEGSGATALHTRRAALVTPANGDIYVRITNTGENSISEAYSLRIEVVADTDEGGSRNDSAELARAVNLGATGSGGYSGTHKLIAQNDVDWYGLSRPSMSENSLVYVRLHAASTAGFVMQAQFYEETSATCSSTSPCAQGRACSPTGHCLDLTVQRPSPDGPGDPQAGGLSPNHIEAQLPLFGPGTGDLYLRVAHNASTILPKAGFDFSATYSMTAQHKAEPDATDRTAPDNAFLNRPQDKDYGDFSPQPRLVSGGLTTGTGTVSMPGFDIRGYITYDGDQDFFRIPVDPIGAGGLTVFLNMAASNVDLRASMWRSGESWRGASIGPFNGSPSDEYDQCISNSCDGPGSCDNERMTCNQPAVTNKSAGSNASSPACVYIARTTGDLIVWVNDIDSNDGDETAEYQLRFDYVEGCPTVCGTCQ